MDDVMNTAATSADRSRHGTRSGVSLGALGVAAVLLVVPLMQGGLVTATLPVLALLTGLAFLAEARRSLFRDRITWREAAPWAYLWLAVSLYIVGQPAARELFQISLNINGIELRRVSWLQHVKYWSFFTAYWMLAWVVSRQSRSSRELIVVAVMIMALFQALYGMLAFVGGQDTILGIWEKTASIGSVSGTFYNRNHLAGLFAVALPLGAAYLFSRRWDPSHHGLPVIRISVAVVFLLITGAALIGTASRLGIFSAAVGFVLWVWLYTRDASSGAYTRYVWLSLLLVPLVAGVWFGPDYLIERLLQIDQATGRLGIWGAMLDAPLGVWIHGVGAGAFHDVFKLIHPVTHFKSVWRAHSEYLQVVFELGMIGIALLAPFVVWWFRRCRPARLSQLQRGALAGVVAILVHSIADFDLQVPGTAVVFWAALGLLFTGSNGGQLPAESRHPSLRIDGRGRARTISAGRSVNN